MVKVNLHKRKTVCALIWSLENSFMLLRGLLNTIRLLYAFLILLVSLLWAGQVVAESIIIDEESDKVTLDNNLISATFIKSEAAISSLKYKGRELLDNGGKGYIQMNSHLGFATPKSTSFSYTKKRSGLVDLSFRQNNDGFPFIVDVHFVMREGIAGIYNYIVVDYDPEKINEAQLLQLNLALRLDPKIFKHIQVADDRYDVLPKISTMQSGVKVMDATYRLPADSAYAKAKAKSNDPVYTKYNWSVMQENHLAHGFMSDAKTDSKFDNIGVWILQPDREHLIGGPTAQELSGHQTATTPVLLRHFTAAHYGSGRLALNRADGYWSKIGGPWVIYVNTGEDHQTLWSDAKQKVKKELAQWPYAWLENSNYPLERTKVTGTFHIEGQKQQSNALILLTESRIDRNPDWQRSGKGYHYYTRTDDNGHFQLDHVRSGRYRMVAIKDGVFGEYAKDGLVIGKADTVELGEIAWNPDNKGELLWQIGSPDRSAAEYKQGDDYRHWGLWQKYPQEFSQDVSFTIGQSKERNDWNYVHAATPDANGKWRSPTWSINFDDRTYDNNQRTGNAWLTIGFAGATINRKLLTGVKVKVNGKKVALIQSLINDRSSYRSGIRGYYRERQIKFDAGLLKQSNNTIELTLAPSKESKTVGNTVDTTPFTAILYDSIKLEVEQATSSTTPSHKIKVAIIGDSTVSDRPEGDIRSGWGEQLSDAFGDKFDIVNYAKPGESSKSFLLNGLWDRALNSNPDYVLIQFGHNDGPNKGERTTEPATSYKFYLQKYIDDVKAMGAIPILVTPMERRKFTKSGKIKATLDKFAQAMKEVAKANELQLIDLHSKSIALYELLGEKESHLLGPKGDKTHFNKKGAKMLSEFLVEQLTILKGIK